MLWLLCLVLTGADTYLMRRLNSEGTKRFRDRGKRLKASMTVDVRYLIIEVHYITTADSNIITGIKYSVGDHFNLHLMEIQDCDAIGKEFQNLETNEDAQSEIESEVEQYAQIHRPDDLLVEFDFVFDSDYDIFEIKVYYNQDTSGQKIKRIEYTDSLDKGRVLEDSRLYQGTFGDVRNQSVRKLILDTVKEHAKLPPKVRDVVEIHVNYVKT